MQSLLCNECIFSIPTGLSDDATLMIGEILQENQFTRPTADQCLQLEFIHGNIIPKALPVYCLLREPRLEDIAFDEGLYIYNMILLWSCKRSLSG